MQFAGIGGLLPASVSVGVESFDQSGRVTGPTTLTQLVCSRFIMKLGFLSYSVIGMFHLDPEVQNSLSVSDTVVITELTPAPCTLFCTAV